MSRISFLMLLWGMVEQRFTVQGVAAAEAASVASEVTLAHMYIPAGYHVYIGSSVILSKPIKFECHSICYYYGTTGSAFIIGNDYTASAASNAQCYDFMLKGMKCCVNKETSLPTGINTSGTCGVEIRQAQ